MSGPIESSVRLVPATLRAAANRLTELAKAATPPPWEQTGEMGSEWDDIVDAPGSTSIVAQCDTSVENAAYITAMSPALGLALADWLKAEAWVLDGLEPFTEVVNAAYQQASGGRAFIRLVRDENGEPAMHCDTTQQALAVARLVLGEAA